MIIHYPRIMPDPKSPIDSPNLINDRGHNGTQVEVLPNHERATPVLDAAKDVDELQRQDSIDAATEIKALRNELGLDAVSENVSRSALPTSTGLTTDRLLGDFAGVARTAEGLLILPHEIKTEVQAPVDNQIRSKRFSLPSLGSGAPTATNYDSKVTNFSTRTSIIKFASGQQVFSIYNYPMSQAHRWFDQIIKAVAGRKRHKVSSGRWKDKFTSKSRIPTFEYSHPDVVLLPYIPNMNAYDVFRYNHEITECGELPWVKDLTAEDKVTLGERIISAIAAIHKDTGGGWGETILQNVIITPQGEPIVVDPEVEFNDDVTQAEQKMDDLKEIVYSMTGAISGSEQLTAVTPIVHRFLAHYPDQALVHKLSETTSTKFSFLRKIQLQLHDLNYFGVTMETFQAITEAIASYHLLK